MTKEELKEHCNIEFQNLEKTVGELYSVFKPGKSEYAVAEQAAIATFILNAYGGFENILRHILMFDGLDIKDSPDWHEKLLKKTAELAILPKELVQILSKYLSFRNLIIYSYIFNTNPEELNVLAEAMKDVLAKFKSEVDEYIQTI